MSETSTGENTVSLRYRFGAFRLDLACRELWRGDDEVPLPPKAFGCLAYLVEHRDRAVARDELIDAVWGKENLADSVLGHAVLAVRRTLDDSGDEHQYVKTVQGFGYRWVAPVELDPMKEPTSTGAAGRHPPVWLWVALASTIARCSFARLRSAWIATIQPPFRG
ncbi:MAG: winged helix-turn-helix domain-containing protein [Thermoanaerobaculia bacterium]